MADLSWVNEPWVTLLRAAREEHGPTAVGRTIGYSASVVIDVCEGRYKADPGRVKEAVMATIGAAEVTCPVLGVIGLDACRKHRKAPFSATNPLRVRLWKACRSCPNNPDAQP